MKKQAEPIKIRVSDADEAWMYVNDKSIDIYIYTEGKGAVSARILESQLKKIT